MTSCFFIEVGSRHQAPCKSRQLLLVVGIFPQDNEALQDRRECNVCEGAVHMIETKNASEVLHTLYTQDTTLSMSQAEKLLHPPALRNKAHIHNIYLV